ncbi:hypothetical protein RFI_14699 [Reticulomyxa filosa]|uniref:Uncharacterized protein n=1 Tax=Reticulomyxa filosa TaxID=46433 RepID=X6NB08_RETFI|nr:hypothetical protein RFI_14699 [Reticulomyxa filosa]|eukprot:ETO22497.1 hypothetical protein RFI_14699 [Reticulomyxa filosa]
MMKSSYGGLGLGLNLNLGLGLGLGLGNNNNNNNNDNGSNNNNNNNIGASIGGSNVGGAMGGNNRDDRGLHSPTILRGALHNFTLEERMHLDLLNEGQLALREQLGKALRRFKTQTEFNE